MFCVLPIVLNELFNKILHVHARLSHCLTLFDIVVGNVRYQGMDSKSTSTERLTIQFPTVTCKRDVI